MNHTPCSIALVLPIYLYHTLLNVHQVLKPSYLRTFYSFFYYYVSKVMPNFLSFFSSSSSNYCLCLLVLLPSGKYDLSLIRFQNW